MFADEFRDAQQTVADARPFRLLSVTGDAHVQRALNVLWREHEVIACDGAAAVALAVERDVDAVLCTQRMPGALGVDLLCEVRQVQPRALRLLVSDRPDPRLLLDAVNEAEVFRLVDQPWDNAALREAALAAGRAARSAPLLTGTPLSDEDAERMRRLNAVVVVENDAATQQRLRDLLQGQYKIHFANTLDRALQFMEQHETGVLVCSTGYARAEVGAALKVLKQAHPHIATIVIDPLADSDRVIELINEAQVFRLLRRPFNPAQCRPFVDAALARHWHIKQQPQSAWRVLPSESAPARSTVQLPAQLLNRIRGLPGRLHEAEAR
jgi:serine/threonine-protein kinase